MIDLSEKDKTGSSELPRLDPPPSRSERWEHFIKRVEHIGCGTVMLTFDHGLPQMVRRLGKKEPMGPMSGAD